MCDSAKEREKYFLLFDEIFFVTPSSGGRKSRKTIIFNRLYRYLSIIGDTSRWEPPRQPKSYLIGSKWSPFGLWSITGVWVALVCIFCEIPDRVRTKSGPGPDLVRTEWIWKYRFWQTLVDYSSRNHVHLFWHQNRMTNDLVASVRSIDSGSLPSWSGPGPDLVRTKSGPVRTSPNPSNRHDICIWAHNYYLVLSLCAFGKLWCLTMHNAE